MMQITRDFEDRATWAQEEQGSVWRSKLIHELHELKTFAGMNETIDKKIEYDHRFFCDTYQAF